VHKDLVWITECDDDTRNEVWSELLKQDQDFCKMLPSRALSHYATHTPPFF
jgi:hypothetical protein